MTAAAVLLFGGTFDPVHNGHLEMAHAAQAELAVSELILVPAGNPWQRGRLPIASAEARVAMLRLAFGAGANIDVRELHRSGPTYTVDTLTELHAERPDCEWHWLIGSDAFARLGTWHRTAELARLTKFVVAARAGEAVTAPSMMAPDRYRVLLAAPPPVSSTAIRERLATGQSFRGFAPDAVCDYIEQHKLYISSEKTP
ncbi:MAG: nicotinate (nicotinamide) nucleotide adenylyltransferase [Betaproteobacteria bacterium]|nr:nicotinate (nicotinamide) nucleotide adenylyltransferase [Betaproteobacteria bacterium]